MEMLHCQGYYSLSGIWTLTRKTHHNLSDSKEGGRRHGTFIGWVGSGNPKLRILSRKINVHLLRNLHLKRGIKAINKLSVEETQ